MLPTRVLSISPAAKVLGAALFSAALLSTAGAAPVYAAANGPDTYRIAGVAGGDTVELKARPFGRGHIVAKLPFNARYIVNTGRTRGRFVKVRYRGATGWLNRRHLAEDQGGATFYRVTGLGRNGALTIHRRPWESARVKGEIPNNARFIPHLGVCAGKWCKVSYRGVRGWVHKHCLIVMRYGPQRERRYDRYPRPYLSDDRRRTLPFGDRRAYWRNIGGTYRQTF